MKDTVGCKTGHFEMRTKYYMYHVSFGVTESEVLTIGFSHNKQCRRRSINVGSRLLISLVYLKYSILDVNISFRYLATFSSYELYGLIRSVAIRIYGL